METHLAFVAYVIAIISLAVSLYVAYLFSEVKDRLPQIKKPQQKPTSKSSKTTPKLKGHWD